MRLLAMCLLGQFLLAAAVLAQDAQTASTDCTFADGTQISLQYHTGKGEDPHNGKIWEPGGGPMVLFAQTPLFLAGSSIPPGAYTVYTIPGKKEWTLIINRNVTAGSKYDPSQDMIHAPMETGEIDKPQKDLQISFAHIAPKICSLRLYYQKAGAFADLNQR
jgi:Protein of unknown function (DUF2911)